MRRTRQATRPRPANGNRRLSFPRGILSRMLDALTSYFASLSPAWFYCGLFLSAYMENIFPPVPGDSVTVFAAYLVGRSERSIAAVVLSATLGSVAGFMTYYMLGRLIHPEYFLRKNFRFLPASHIERAGRWFRRHGCWIILLNRFLSGARSVISIACGIYRLPWPSVLIFSTLGCAIWNSLLIWAGYLLGANWRVVDQILRRYSILLLSLAALLTAAWLVRRIVNQRRISR
jgi:membrane protein DedA with SNARE-associated domain